MSIDAIGTTDGLTILWNPSLVILYNFFTTKWSITVEFRVIGSNKPGLLTNFYFLVTQRDKLPFLQNLDWINNLIGNKIWILGDDFNMICNLEKKRGGIRRLEGGNDHFQALIDKLSLVYLDTHNGVFTW
jgi:hypothetical protein